MKRAFGNGGVFWYGEESGSRFITLPMSRHFLGERATTEIWVRSERIATASDYNCPSCSCRLRMVPLPKWIDDGVIDVCRRCHLFFIHPGLHRQIPDSHDLLFPQGDGTLAGQVGQQFSEILMQKDKQNIREQSILAEPPEELHKGILAFLGLPVEESRQTPALHVWVTGTFIVGLIFIHWIINREYVSAIQVYGFYPNLFFKNYGLNILISPLLHANIWHLISNLYFFYILSDDVESHLGYKKYFLFFVLSSIFIALFSFLITEHPDSPHIGLSGFIMALMSYYVLQFRRANFLFVVPAFFVTGFSRASSMALRGAQWLRVRAWVIALYYLITQVFLFWISSKTHASRISHSSHIAGLIAGWIFWHFFGTKENISSDAIDVRGQNIHPPLLNKKSDKL